MNTILLHCARLFVRLHFWVVAVLVFSRVQPRSLLSRKAKVHFEYACMMGRHSSFVRRTFAVLLRQELNRSTESNLWLAKIAWTLGHMKLAASIYRRTVKLERTSELQRVVACQQAFVEGLLNGRIIREISDALSGLTLPGPDVGSLILCPVSSRYFDLFELWSEQVNYYCPRHHLLVLALDPGTASRLRQRSNTSVLELSAYFVFHENGVIHPYVRSNLWILRVILLRELVARGHPVLSLDLDALVVGDLFGLIDSFPDSDIIAQQDYSIPMDVARKFGFIICCGFLHVRANQKTLAFLSDYVSQTTLETDDQIALNHLLDKVGLAVTVRNRSFMQFFAAGLSWVCPDRSLVSRDLRYGSIIRHFQQNGESIEELKRSIIPCCTAI
jgi:Nucleotide-diphospho-sugar transferase